MQSALNPFSPGSGLKPPALVGRDEQLGAMDVTIRRSHAGMPCRGIVLTGLRGVGKTVLLNEMHDRAEDAGWFVVSLEARVDPPGSSSVRRALARDIAVAARRLRHQHGLTDRIRRALEAVASFNLKFGVSGIDLGVQAAPGRADSGDLEVDLPELIADLAIALAEHRSSFGLFIDEMQDLDSDLIRALLVAQHRCGQRGWPFYLMGAGLPNLPTVLASARSYAERLFDYRTIGTLTPAQAALALTQPAAHHDVTFDPAALHTLFAASGGYPYFLQEYGWAAWESAAGPQITQSDAATAVTLGRQRLDSGFFLSRWNRATPAERRALVAMAEDGDRPSESGEVARRMGIRPSSLGPYRARLIAKGLVYAPDHGLLAYTVPGMAGFVHRHREET